MNDCFTPSAAPQTHPCHTPTCRELFVGFLSLGMTAFGGALPLAHRMIVELRHWADEAEFTELLGLCQFLPGGNICNLSVAIGMRACGVRGALSAILGLLAMPSVVVVLLSTLYSHYQNDPSLQHMFFGLAAAAAGLLIRMAVKLALPLRHDPVRIALAVLCFAMIAALRIPLLWTMLLLTPLSIGICLYWDKAVSKGNK